MGSWRHWLVLLLCAGGTAAQALEAVTLQLNWRHQFEFAAFYAAIEQGYYQSAGLEVTLREGGPAHSPITTVMHGQADFGVANSSLIIERHRGQAVVALAALMQHSAIAVLARRDHGIENVTDLANRPIACASHACEEIQAYLRASGLNKEQIRLVPHKDATLEALRSGALSAIEIYSTNQPFWVRGEEHRYILLTPRSAGIDLFGNVLFTSAERLEQSPDLVRRFREASLQGLVYASQHPEALADLILRRYNTQNKSREHLLFEASHLHDVTRLDLVEAGYMSPDRWRHVAAVYASLGMLPDKIDWHGFLYDAHPQKIPVWMVGAAAALLVIALTAVAVTSVFFRMNTRLRAEISERKAVESKLHKGQSEFRQFVEDANSLISHEMQTPLAVIKIHLDVLTLKMQTKWAGEHNLTAMQQAVDRLQGLFGERLKQVFGAASLIAHRRQLALETELQRIVERFCRLWPQCTVRWEGDRPSQAYAMVAPDMLQTLVFNLLENAVKYSPPDASISLGLESAEGFWCITFTNPCASPLPDDLEHLFDKHVRGNNQQVAGTGMGLYLVRMIVQAHAGSVVAQRLPGDRFQIAFTLPMSPGTEPASTPPP